MATRRLAINGATTALRGGSSRLAGSGSSSSSATIPTAAAHILRASFGTTPPLAPQATRGTAGVVARPQLLRRIIPTSVRWSSDSAAGSGSKIWNFEELKTAISTPNSTPKVTIIDTREPSELSSTGRIPGALNIPIVSAPDSFHIPADEFADRFGFERPVPDGDGEAVVFYCKAGVRSRAAAQIAREAGWKNVGEYPGSWLDWVQKGGKIER
ncbi:Rhodanese-like protein [Daldinia vernicosa]|uniref:Rhodanese-like protein n=1 Tax=Daldinia vernicosa TaxID=114800 RepID=UPI00200872C7|nr:Rhodanese-like protein [Daldinia vernicosa]KAI0844721.1 Rhodanese-like protein [Daldinia vernicosa]